MSQTTGFNETAAGNAIDLIISGGADIRLTTAKIDYGDGDTELTSKEVSAADYEILTIPEAEWTVSYNASTNTATLTNDNEVGYGEITNDWGVIIDFAIQNPGTDEFIIADEPNDPELTSGEDVAFPPGSITYTLGD